MVPGNGCWRGWGAVGYGARWWACSGTLEVALMREKRGARGADPAQTSSGSNHPASSGSNLIRLKLWQAPPRPDLIVACRLSPGSRGSTQETHVP